VAHNQGLKRREANGRLLRLVVRDPEAIDDPVSPVPDPETQARRRQHRERVLARARMLSEADRRCLYLRIEGLRYREISRVLDISLGGVALSLERSLAALADDRKD
jgi:RNA polymerase sigma-70 factor (ECF subfamily)